MQRSPASAREGQLRMPTAKRGRARIDIAASPERVFGLITDVTRMGEWSPECYRCAWLDGASAAVPGARFRGYNRLGRYRGQTTAGGKRPRNGRAFPPPHIPTKKGGGTPARATRASSTSSGDAT